MDTIEQRVIIPASPTVIWNIISQLDQNPTWQVDCRRFQFTGQKRQGRGTRWRQITANGQEQLFEITAWYDEVGYEYRLVEGALFDECAGRIKMHETPDGTVVHWEFQYALSGFMSGLRNTLLTRRNLDNMIGESLWALWELANHEKINQPRDYVYRSMMRDAPNVEQRANYVMREHNREGPSLIIAEPPISVDDTRPNELLNPDEADSTVQDDQPSPFMQPAKADSPPTEEVTASVEAQLTAPELVQESVDTTQEADIEEPIMPVSTPEVLQTEVIPRPPELTYIDEPVEDTSEVSVFDLFGVDRPPAPKAPLAELIKTEQQPALEEAPPDEPETAPQPTFTSSGRRGLRVVMRRRLVDIQRPED